MEAKRLVEVLRSRGMTCATAESCTGGGVGAAITAVPGASEVFLGGIVSYANSVKRDVLGVDGELLDGVGPISAECAAQMAAGVRELLKSDIAVSVTGLAGPGGDGAHPAGFVWFGLATADGVATENKTFPGDRENVRAAAVEHAISLLLSKAESACTR